MHRLDITHKQSAHTHKVKILEFIKINTEISLYVVFIMSLYLSSYMVFETLSVSAGPLTSYRDSSLTFHHSSH